MKARKLIALAAVLLLIVALTVAVAPTLAYGYQGPGPHGPKKPSATYFAWVLENLSPTNLALAFPIVPIS